MPSSPDVRASVRRGELPVAPDTVAPLLVHGRERATDQLDGFRSGREAGYAVGLEEGRRRGQAELNSVIQMLRTVLAQAEARTITDRAAFEELAIHLAVELAEVIIGHEMTIDPGRTLIARALSLRTGREPVAIHLHPDEAALVDQVEGSEVAIVADQGCAPGSAFAEYGQGFADISVESAMARVREALQ